MFAWFKDLFNGLTKAIFDGLAWIWDAILQAIINLAMDAADWAMGQLPGMSQFNLQDRIDDLFQNQAIQFIMYLIPFQPMATIFFLAFSAAATIRTLRFIIGWIPTIEG